MTRRQLVGSLGAGAIFSTAGLDAAPRKKTQAAPVRPLTEDVLRLGVCSYSFHNFQRNLAIRLMSELGVRYVSVKDVHLPYTASQEEAAKARGAFQKAGLQIVSGGNMPLESDSEKELRSYFDYAKMCGMPMIVGAPTAKSLPILEKLVREYDIRLAIHNHGPEDENFPSPQSVLKVIKEMDPRIGLCIDAGHTMRAGSDVVESLAEAGPRLFDMHMKDLRSSRDKASQCDVGDGVMPTVAIFKQLEKMQYKGCINLEYEINSDSPVPGMLHSIGYMRGVLAGIAG